MVGLRPDFRKNMGVFLSVSQSGSRLELTLKRVMRPAAPGVFDQKRLLVGWLADWVGGWVGGWVREGSHPGGRRLVAVDSGSQSA